MSNYRKVFAFAFLALLAATGLTANYSTDAFNVSVHLQKDRTVRIDEKITVRFKVKQHGLIRTIPFRYGTGSESRSVDFRLLGVKLGDKAENVRESFEGNQWVLKIGSGSRWVDGTKTYTISYQVRGAMTDFNDAKAIGPRTEFFWNLLPTKWATGIDSAEFAIHFPKPPKNDYLARLVAGKVGTRKGIEVDEKGRVTGNKGVVTVVSHSATSLGFRLKESLAQGESATLVLGLPLGAFDEMEPESSTPPNLYRYPESSTYVLPHLVERPFNPLYALIPFAPLALYALLFHRRIWGRRTPLVARFDPPDGVGPAEAGYIWDEKVTPADFVAGLLGLAQKGAVTLVGDPGLARVDVQIKPLSHISVLSRFESHLYAILAPFGPVVSSEHLRGNFAPHFRTLNNTLVTQLRKEGIIGYSGLPSCIAALAMFTIFGSIVFLAFSAGVWEVAGAIAALVILIVLSTKTSAFTDKGWRVKSEVDGLHEFISRAKDSELSYMSHIAPDQALFERLLPYAVAFGLARTWTLAFKGIELQRPEWFLGPNPTDVIWTSHIAGTLGMFENDWSEAMVYTPPEIIDNSSGKLFGSRSSGFDSSSFGSSDSGSSSSYDSSSGSFDSGGSVGDGGGGGGGDSW